MKEIPTSQVMQAKKILTLADHGVIIISQAGQVAPLKQGGKI